MVGEKQLVQKFRSKRSQETYEVILTEKGFSCNCKGWIYRKYCKHLEYVLSNYMTKDGSVKSIFSEITDIPTREEAEIMDYSRNSEETQKWHNNHVKVIEI